MKKIKTIVIYAMLLAVLSTFLGGCALNNKGLIEQINKEINVNNVLDATVGSYVLPGLSAKLIKMGVKVEYTVKDYLGNSVEVSDGKFNVVAGNEYTVSLSVKNQQGEILVNKIFSITENGTLSYKLTETEINDLKVKRDKVLIDIFADMEIDYNVYKSLSYIDKQHITEASKLDMIDNVLNNELLISGLSKQALMAVFDNVSALYKAKDDLENKDKDVPKYFNELFDKAFAPILSGAESSIAIADIIFKQYVNYAQQSVNKFQMEFDLYNATANVADDVITMTDEQIKQYVKTVKINIEEKIVELSSFSNDEFAVNVYNLLADYGVVPTLNSKQLEDAFTLNKGRLKQKIIGLKTNVKSFFYTLLGAEMFANQNYKALIFDRYSYSYYINTQTFNAFATETMPINIAVTLYDTVFNLPYSADFFPNLHIAQESDYSLIVEAFKEKVKTQKYQPHYDAVLADLNNAKSDVEDIKADRATIVESLAMTVKISEIISPIVNSNIGKDLILYAACDALGIKYSNDYVDDDNNEFEYNVADLSAILTSVSGKIDNFVVKYSVELDNLDFNALKSAGYYLSDKFNDWASGDKVSKNTVTNILTKHLIVSKPLMSSIKQLIVKLNTEKTIDYFAKALTYKDNNSEDENYLLTVNQNVAQAFTIKNVLDASKGGMTIDEYIESIKADINADIALANGISDENIEKYSTKLKSFYLLSIDTLSFADSNFIVDMPEDAAGFKAVQDVLNNRWTELMKK